MNVSWSAHQLAELLAVLTLCDDETTAVQVAIDRAAEAFDAEIVALVLPEPAPIVAIGFGHAEPPEHCLRQAAAGELDALDVPGVGLAPVLTTPLDEGGALVLARSGEPFNAEDMGLARGLARVLSLHLRQLRLYEAERSARTELQERQRLLERLYGIQQAIARRQPLERVLDAICEATAEIMGESIVGIRLVDEENPDQAPLVAWVGLDEVPDSVRNRPTRSGLSGRAMNERRLVVATDYRATLGHDHWYEANGICSSMAAPVTRDNVVVGGMIVSSTRPRQFSPLEQETLLTFAEHVSLALNDASALTAMSEALDDALHQATHDPLTSLPNRALVLDRLGLAIGRTGRTGTSVTLLFVDLDRFKRVNDYLGHHQGDAVLIAVAQRLTACLRPGDTVGRLAGDEFVVIAEDLDDAEAGQLATRLADAIAEPLPLDGRDLVVTASIGIARGAVGVRAEELLGDADVALYRAKAEGRSRIERFDQALRTRMATRSETEQALRRAMRDHELRVWFQPTIWSPTREPLAVEALVRWERPGHGLVAPADFIPLAEDTGQIVPLGAWVLEEACRQVATWRAEEPQLAHLLVAVNLSPRQLTDPGLSGLVARVLRDTGLPADALWLEITEHVFLEEDEATLANMQALHRAGVRFVMDDFGTGYSSLTYLKRFPVSSIKIDRSFVDGVGRDHGDEAIVTAIIRLGEAMGLAVVAEGVERAQQVTDLHRLGCDMVQGYFFGRPAPADEARRAMLEMVPAEPPRAGDREERPRAGAQP